jgi:hypothetical protein
MSSVHWYVIATPSLVMPACPVDVTGYGDRTNDLAGWPALSHYLVLKTIAGTSSSATKGEGRQNMLCAYLSVALLLGLGANALFGLWRADPVTALVIAGVAIKEGREPWRGEACCAADAGLDTADSAPCCSDPHCSCCQHE